jgi:hypothetical protein
MIQNIGNAPETGSLQAGETLSPRSQLVSDFFDHMNRQDVPWVVMNNYDGLPEVIPSDIDFSIPPALFFRLDVFICDFAEMVGARLVQKLWHGNMKCAYILATGSEGAREFVQLDFFTAFSTKSAPSLITHDDLVAGRRPLKNFHVPRPEVELVFTAMRRLFKNDWSERHCARIAELADQIGEPAWVPESYPWMHGTLEAARRGDVASVSARRKADWAQLRKAGRMNMSFSQKVANAALQARRLVVRLRDETGQLVILAAPRSSISGETLDALDLVFHRRIFVDAASGLGFFWKLALLKRRKGLIFILAGTENPKGNSVARYAAKLGLADQILYTQGPLGTDLQELRLPARQLSSDATVIEAIMNTQAAKTKRAVAHKGTQTSGSYI